MCNLVVDDDGLFVIIDPLLTFNWKEELDLWIALFADDNCRSRMDIEFSLSSSLSSSFLVSWRKITFLLIVRLSGIVFSFDSDEIPLLLQPLCFESDLMPGLQAGCNRNGSWQSLLGKSLIMKSSRTKRNLRTKSVHTKNQPLGWNEWRISDRNPINQIKRQCTNRKRW